MARAYEITSNETDKKIVDTFFEALYNNHSYATAGEQTSTFPSPTHLLTQN